MRFCGSKTTDNKYCLQIICYVIKNGGGQKIILSGRKYGKMDETYYPYILSHCLVSYADGGKEKHYKQEIPKARRIKRC